ncbi:hypothetical protein EJ110_NYTH30728 [Nymphaea thermarum]|nr:hypothetical protein EJ110_NYTH30728 [Nymphaea thermarum]
MKMIWTDLAVASWSFLALHHHDQIQSSGLSDLELGMADNGLAFFNTMPNFSSVSIFSPSTTCQSNECMTEAKIRATILSAMSLPTHIRRPEPNGI